jgi:hypothetical protein
MTPPRSSIDLVDRLEREAMIWMWPMAINTWCISETELSTVGKILLIDVLEKFDEMLDMRM